MSSKHRRVLGYAALVAVFACCAAGSAVAQDVAYNAMPGTDFSKFKTYKWVAIEGALHPDQIVEQQIKQAIESQLAAKGLTKKESDPVEIGRAHV